MSIPIVGLLQSQLERLRLYHLERVYLGKRYISVIREFTPGYTPRTSNDLARLDERGYHCTMGKAQGYIVSINGPEGLEEPCGSNQKEIAQHNAGAITSNFDEKVAELERAGVLEGITVYAKMRFISTLSIDGSPEKVEALKQHLEQNNIGTLCGNLKLRASPVIPSGGGPGTDNF